MNIPKITDFDISSKKVIVRGDVDLGDEIREGDEVKLNTIIPTIKYLIQKECKIIIIGHRGRPADAEALAGEARRIKFENLSLRRVSELLSGLLEKEVKFVDEILGEKVSGEVKNLGSSDISMLENLRFDSREEANDENFARELASLGEIYVNEAFSSSHRAHASIVGIPKFLPHAAGFRLVEEVEHLSRVIENPERPLIFLISGVKEDKLEMINGIADKADKIWVGGRLPEYMEKITSYKLQTTNEKLMVAQLNPDKEDITIRSIENFETEIKRAKTIVLAGVVGKYEDEGHRQGTKRVFEAVADSSAYKVAGGGDTEAAIAMFNLVNKFDWISVGGGAMLEFLAKGTLPGIEALVQV